MHELEILALPEGTPIKVNGIEGTLKFHKDYLKGSLGKIRLPYHPFGIKATDSGIITFKYPAVAYSILKEESSEKQQKIDKGITLLFGVIKSQIEYHNFFNPDDPMEMSEVLNHLRTRILKY